jgi:hypothetical protein
MKNINMKKEYNILLRKICILENKAEFYRKRCEHFCCEYKRSERKYREIVSLNITVKEIIYRDFLSVITAKQEFYNNRPHSISARICLNDLKNDIERFKDE